METEYEELTGQLQAIKHAEIIPLPPVVQRLGAQLPEQVSHPQSVTRQILQPVGNQLLQDPANALPGKLAASALVVTHPQVPSSAQAVHWGSICIDSILLALLCIKIIHPETSALVIFEYQ